MEVIYSYSRAQAIEDGVLVDVSETAKEAGFKIPTALTRAVWDDCVRVPAGVSDQDEDGRLWDVLWMSAFAIRNCRAKQRIDTVLVELCVRNTSDQPAKRVTLKAVCGPSDDLQPVITVMFPNED